MPTFSFAIDEAHLEACAGEALDILNHHRALRDERYWNSSFYSRLQRTLRVIGITLSLFGLVLSATLALLQPQWCRDHDFLQWVWALFLAFTLAFVFFPKINTRIIHAVKKVAIRQNQKFAKRCLRKVESLVPFTALYDIEAEVIENHRLVNDEKVFAWKRKLKGYARVGENIVFIYKKPSSHYPYITLLNRNDDSFIEALRISGIKVLED